MSECLGPNCKHASHFDKDGRRIIEDRIPDPEPKPQQDRKVLTRNQLKARRRKGLPGY